MSGINPTNPSIPGIINNLTSTPVESNAQSSSSSQTISRVASQSLETVAPTSSVFLRARSLSGLASRCPPTPGKRKGSTLDRIYDAKRLRISGPYFEEALKIAEKMEKRDFSPFNITIGDRTIRITERVRKLDDDGLGSYSDVYLVRGTGLQVEEFVLKVLKEKPLREWGITREKGIKKLQEEIDQYHQLKREFSVLGDHYIAPHFDLDIALEEGEDGHSLAHGCHLVKYIRNPLIEDLKFTKELFPAGSQENYIDSELKKVFKLVHERKLPLDLVRANAGIDEEGKLVFFDPMLPEKYGSFERTPGRCLDSLAPSGSERSKYLDPR